MALWRGRLVRRWVRVLSLSVGLFGLAAVGPISASAESMKEALASAYVGNPTLKAARAQQRAVDEEVPQALSGWRPTVTATGAGGFETQRQSGKAIETVNGDVTTARSVTKVTTSNTSPADFAITLSQPIFNGFQTVATTAQAEADVEAGRQDLLGSEQQVLFSGVTAYMDVVRDRQVVSLRQKNVGNLAEQLRATDARFSVGEITKTDVEQARAALAQSKSDLSVAQGSLATSIATYVQVIGHSPGTLKAPPTAGLLPASMEAALAMAETINPSILAAAFVEQSAQHTIDVVKSQLLPQLSLQAQYAVSHEPQPGVNTSQDGIVQGVLSVPLYEAGNIYSQVRQAKQIASQRRIEIIEASRAVRQAVVSSWNQLIAAREVVVSAREQVKANTVALEGVKQEALVGTRTTQDILDADQLLINSQVALVSAQADEVIFAYQVLSSIGHLTAAHLALPVEVYDPTSNYRRVRGKWIGLKANTIQ